MHIKWPGRMCVLCLGNAPLSKEHLIPEILGGNLTCTFLCRKCNSTLGASFEAGIKADPSIRICAANLRPQIPKLADRLVEGQRFVSAGPGGNERGIVREGYFRVKSRRAEDASLIQPTDCARRSVDKILKKSGAGPAPIAEATKRFDEAGENQKVTLAPGLEIVKWSVEEVQPDFSSSKHMSALVPLKIGFEFLACHLGCDIYGDAPQLHELRRALCDMIEDHSCFQVERLNASKYEPFHGICFEGNNPHARVLIRLFGWLAFRVHFRGLSVGGSRFIYTHYLDTNREDIRILGSQSGAHYQSR